MCASRKREKEKKLKQTNQSKIENTCIKNTLTVDKVRDSKGLTVGGRRPIQMSKSSQVLFWTPNRGMRIQHTIK